MGKVSYPLLILKGILIGFASLGVPGLSASTIAIVLFVYYDMIYAISHIFSKPKKSITFLAVLLTGYSIGCLGGAFMVNTLYVAYPIPVIAAVLGFLIGSVPRMAAESKDDLKKPVNWAVMLCVAALFLVYALVITNGDTVTFDKHLGLSDYLMMMLVGAITSTTLVIPGVDFAVTLMALGYYYAFIGLVGNIPALLVSPQRLILLAVYLVGYGLGSVLFSKGLRVLIKRFPRQLHCVNLAMVTISPIIVVKKCIIDNPNEKTFLANITWKAWVWAFIMFAVGYFAFTWVPMLLRYVGILPKNPDKQAVEAIRSIQEGKKPALLSSAKKEQEQDEEMPDAADMCPPNE
jgi:putative membrane protein